MTTRNLRGEDDNCYAHAEAAVGACIYGRRRWKKIYMGIFLWPRARMNIKSVGWYIRVPRRARSYDVFYTRAFWFANGQALFIADVHHERVALFSRILFTIYCRVYGVYWE